VDILFSSPLWNTKNSRTIQKRHGHYSLTSLFSETMHTNRGWSWRNTTNDVFLIQVTPACPIHTKIGKSKTKAQLMANFHPWCIRVVSNEGDRLKDNKTIIVKGVHRFWFVERGPWLLITEAGGGKGCNSRTLSMI